MPLAAVLLVKSLEGMSGVQGGLGEQKRDILKLREEALLEHGTAVEDINTSGTLRTPVLLTWDTVR